MGKELMMAVDLGTSFIKSAVYDMDGNRIASGKEPVQSLQPAPGCFIQKGGDLMASVLRCMKAAADQTENVQDIAVLSFSGQMAGFMAVGSDWEDITGWSCSADTRYVPFANRQMAQFADDFYSICGTNSPLFSTQYAWFASEFPQEAKRISKYLMLTGYVIGNLGDRSVEDAVIDRSLITWTGLADVKNARWSEKLCDELHVPMDRLPRITESYEVVNRLSRKAAELTGLSEGLPIVSGAGDKIAGCTGAGNLRPGDMLFEAASFGAVSCVTEDFRLDQEHRGFDLLNSIGGKYCAHFYMPGSGITQEWFVNQFCRDRNESLTEAFDRMDQEMAAVPAGSDGLFAEGMLSGTVMPFNGDLRGAFVGETWTHTRAHFYRALMESFAYALGSAISRITAVYPEYAAQKKIRMIGGGAKSPAQAQLYADVLGKQMETIPVKDPALWGACLLGAKGIGLVDDLPSYAEKFVQNGKAYEPDPEKTNLYRKYADIYYEFNEQLTEMSRKLQKVNHL